MSNSQEYLSLFVSTNFLTRWPLSAGFPNAPTEPRGVYFGVLGADDTGEEALNFERLDLAFDFRTTGSGEFAADEGDGSLSSAERDPMSSSSSFASSASLASGM